MADRVNPFDEALREALKSNTRTYNPGIGAFETATTQEIIAEGWHGQYRWTVHKDPIFTPIFVSMGLTGSFTLFGATISYAAIASAIATTAIVAGVQYLMTPKPPKPEDGRAPLTQPVPYRFWGVGEARLAGALMLWEASDGLMFSVQAIVAHRINAFTSYYLHDDKVTINGLGQVDGLPGGRYSDGGDNHWVNIYSRVGLTPETAFPVIVSRLGGAGIWTDAHRGDGQASVGMICVSPEMQDFQKVFPYGKPALSVTAELALVWDFRDPAQSPENPATWTFSKNPVLQLAWHECFNPFGTKRDYRKALLPVLDMWQEEADVCDEAVPKAAGGTERRYECGGFDSTEHDPKGGTNAILASMDGWMCDRGDGALLIVAGKFREKYVATLTDADIVGSVIQHDVLFEEEVNRFVPKFTFPATDFTTTDTDFFDDLPAQLTAGRVLSTEGNFPWVQQWRQARRLGKREFARLRQKKRGTLDVRFTGINAIYAPWVRLETPRSLPGLNGKLISNRRSVLSISRGGFQMTWIKMPDDIEAWNPATDEGAAPPVPNKPASSGIPEPTVDTVVAVSGGGSVYIRVVLIDPARVDLTPVVHYRVADIGGGVPGAWIEQRFPGSVPAAGLIVVNTNPVPVDKSIDVQSAYIGSNGTYGPWSSTSTVVSTMDLTPPGACTAISIVGRDGYATIAYTTPVASNLKDVVVYKVAPGATPSDTDIVSSLTQLVPPATPTPKSLVYGDNTVVNLAANGDFAAAGTWGYATGWAYNGGTLRADHTSAADNSLSQPWVYAAGTYRWGVDITAQSAAGTGLYPRFGGTGPVDGAPQSGVGTKFWTLIPAATNAFITLRASTWVGSIDNVRVFKETVNCAPQGPFDFYLKARNASNVGTLQGPYSITIV